MKTILAGLLLTILVAIAVEGGSNSSRRIRMNALRTANTATSVPVQYPCRFDCQQLVYASTGAPLFPTCTKSVVSYNGDFFLNQPANNTIDYTCFTPYTYQNYFSSRGKLAEVVNTCQSAVHGCVKADGSTFDTQAGSQRDYPGLPLISSLVVVTTLPYYQWYSQFLSVRVVNNYVRCPPEFSRAGHGSGRGNSRCGCDGALYPQLFSSNARMRTGSDQFTDNCPATSTPSVNYCPPFLGQGPANPHPTVTGESSVLAQQARSVSASVQTGLNPHCLHPDVDITHECDDGN